MTFLIQQDTFPALDKLLAQSFSARDSILVRWHSLMHVFLPWINLCLQSLITCHVSDIFPSVHFCLAVTALLHSTSVWAQAEPFWTGILNVWVLLRQRSLVSISASLLWTLSKHLHFRHTYRKALMRCQLCRSSKLWVIGPSCPLRNSERLNTDTLMMLSLTLWERVNFTGLMKPGSWQKTQEGGWTLVSPYCN